LEKKEIEGEENNKMRVSGAEWGILEVP